MPRSPRTRLNLRGEPPAEAQLEPEIHNSLADAKQERPKTLHPRLSAGRSALERFPKPAAQALR